MPEMNQITVSTRLSLSLIHISPVTSLIYRIIFGIAIVGDLLYLVAYESWNHSAD